MAYYSTIACPFDAAIARVTEELQKEGFGILTEIAAVAAVVSAVGPPTSMQAGDDPAAITPGVNVYCESMRPWVAEVAKIRSFPQGPGC